MLQISKCFNVHNDNYDSNVDNEYVEDYAEEEYNERYTMYDNDTRSHFLEWESYNQYTELWLMSKEDKINENDIYYLHNSSLNSKMILNERKYRKTLFLEKDRYTNIFSLQCKEVYIRRNCCDICGDKCMSLRYCRGKLYDEEDDYEYEICNLFTSYIESLLFFKILCQSINPMKIKEKTYDFRINKILVLELYKILNNRIYFKKLKFNI
jgi:hypothetical protein